MTLDTNGGRCNAAALTTHYCLQLPADHTPECLLANRTMHHILINCIQYTMSNSSKGRLTGSQARVYYFLQMVSM